MFLLNTKKKNTENVLTSFDNFLNKNVVVVDESNTDSKKEKMSSSYEKFLKKDAEEDIVSNFLKPSLVYIKEPSVSLGSFGYLGNNYFIGFISKSIIFQIKLYNELYKIWMHPRLGLNIIEINNFDNEESDLVIIKVSNDEYLEHLKPINFITPDHFFNCEQLSNIFVCIDKMGKENVIKVSEITAQHLVIENVIQLERGALLLSNTKVVGMFSHADGMKYYFYRLSSVFDWICKFISNYSNTLFKGLNTQVPFYTKEQLINIISHLNHKIDLFNIKLEDIDKNTLKTSFKLLSDSNEIQKEEQMKSMIETINYLTTKVNEQDKQMKHVMTILKKLGFN